MKTRGKIDQAIFELLDDLMTKDRDATEGYLKAAENVSDSRFRDLFLRYSKQRGQFVKDLKTEIDRLGGDFEDRTSFLSTMHRIWMDIQGTFTGRDNQAILQECLRGEISARHDYQEAARNEYLPEPVKELILHHIELINKSIEEIESFIDNDSSGGSKTMKVEDTPVDLIVK